MDERDKNEPRGVTNNERDRAAMIERRRKAGDVLPFSPAMPCDRGKFLDRGRFSNNIPLPESRCGVMTEPSEQLAAANLQLVDADPCQEWDSAVAWRMSVFHEDRPTAVDRLLATHEGSAKWLRCQKWDAAQPKIVNGVRTGNWGNKAPATLRRIVRKP